MYKNRLQNFTRMLLAPSVLMFAISLVFLLLSQVQTYRIHPFSSDDVAWQTQLLTWRPFNGHVAAQGDTAPFVDKLPLFIAIDDLFTPSRHVLFAESFGLEVIGFGLLYGASLYFLRRQGIKPSYLNLLPLVWLASFGYDFAQLYLNANWRGPDIGVTFLTFAAAALLWQTRFRTRPLPRVVWFCLLLAVLVAGVMIYSDPHYLYFTVAPLSVFGLWLLYQKVITGKQYGILIGTVGLSLIVAKIAQAISIASGIKIMSVYPAQFIDYGQLFSNIAVTIHCILIIFGADFTGYKLISPASFSALLNLGMVLIIATVVYRICRSYVRSIRNGVKIDQSASWNVLFSAVIVECVLLFAFSSLSGGSASNYRYFLVAVFAAVLLLTLKVSVTTPKVRRAIVVVLIVATAGNLYLTLRQSGPYAAASTIAGGNRANYGNYEIVKAAENSGAYKGYAVYWQANIDTYLSGNAVSVLPAACGANDKTVRFKWLVDESRFRAQSGPVKSFYLVDPDIPGPPTCTIPQLESQFGAPESVRLVGDKKLLIYNYDIGTRIGD